jgi:hypothetical protein
MIRYLCIHLSIHMYMDIYTSIQSKHLVSGDAPLKSKYHDLQQNLTLGKVLTPQKELIHPRLPLNFGTYKPKMKWKKKKILRAIPLF